MPDGNPYLDVQEQLKVNSLPSLIKAASLPVFSLHCVYHHHQATQSRNLQRHLNSPSSSLSISNQSVSFSDSTL